MLAEAEKAINDLLAEKPADNQMTLTDIERLVGRVGQQVQANVLRELGVLAEKSIRSRDGGEQTSAGTGGAAQWVSLFPIQERDGEPN